MYSDHEHTNTLEIIALRLLKPEFVRNYEVTALCSFDHPANLHMDKSDLKYMGLAGSQGGT